MGTVYDQPTSLTRIVNAGTKFITLTYFDNGACYVYSYSAEKDLFTYAGSALNYNSTKQSGADATPNVVRVQIYEVDTTKFTLSLLHDIEA
jgi:hypothetical protein